MVVTEKLLDYVINEQNNNNSLVALVDRLYQTNKLFCSYSVFVLYDMCLYVGPGPTCFQDLGLRSRITQQQQQTVHSIEYRSYHPDPPVGPRSYVGLY